MANKAISALRVPFFSYGRRGRKIGKICKDAQVTFVCGLVTFMVLRSCIGAGKFVEPIEDFYEIQNFLHGKVHLHKLHAEMNELMAESARDLPFLPDEVDKENAKASESLFTPNLKISTWDRKRQMWLAKNQSFSIHINGKPRILFVAGAQPKLCQNAIGNHYLPKFLKNKIDYCRLHGIEIFKSSEQLDSLIQTTGVWGKLPLIRKLMVSRREVQWVWWMDSDAMFSDMAFEVPIEKYNDYNIVLYGFEEPIYNNKDRGILSTGGFLLRNCQWSLDFLDAWALMKPQGDRRLLTRGLDWRAEFETDDRSALIYLLITERSKWGNKVFLESSDYFQGNLAVNQGDKHVNMNQMDKFRPGADDEHWPFITHFTGCKPCASSENYIGDARRCLQQMERAFNHADHQILQTQAGSKHWSFRATGRNSQEGTK